MSRQASSFTLGVEEEYQIIDPITRELSPAAQDLLPRAQELLGNAVQYELTLSQIEIATPVCRTLADVRAELTRLRQGMIAAAAQIDKQIAAAGTHPFSPWQAEPITPQPRYEQLVEAYQQAIRRQLIWGCHVHVGLSDREAGVFVLNATRAWLPLLVTLSASSPFWLGEDTEYASFRTGLWWASPLSGPPPAFASRAEYDALVQTLVKTKSVEDAMSIYWDIRLSERFPTIEFRVMDVCMTVDEAVMIAGLVRALVEMCYEQVTRGELFPTVSTDLVRAANWRAARYGLRGDLVDVLAEQIVPAPKLVETFLEFVRPRLEAEGDWEMISSLVHKILEEGNGALRQRQVYKHTGRLEDVVDFTVAETAKGTF